MGNQIYRKKINCISRRYDKLQYDFRGAFMLFDGLHLKKTILDQFYVKKKLALSLRNLMKPL